jgi:hypothetical protein
MQACLIWWLRHCPIAEMLVLHVQANGFCRLSMGNGGFATTRYRNQRLCQKEPSPHQYTILPNANTRDKRKAMHPAYF